MGRRESGGVEVFGELPWRAVTGPEPRSAERAFLIGFLGNSALAALKLVVGWTAGSRALVADGWHSLSDVAVNGGTWIAHRFARRAPDEDHHYGHGKLEAFSGLVVGLVLIGGGIAVVVSAWTSEAHLAEGWSVWLALGVAVASILINIGLADVARRGARTSKSQGLAVLARDNLSDALASGLVVLGILGARAGLGWAEPVMAVGIGGLIVWMGWRSITDGFNVLMDRADPSLRERIHTTALGVGEVRGVQSVRVHPLGTNVSVDMEISVDGDLSVGDGHRIAHSVESAVTATHSFVGEVNVHVNPWTPPTGARPAGETSPDPLPATDRDLID